MIRGVLATASSARQKLFTQFFSNYFSELIVFPSNIEEEKIMENYKTKEPEEIVIMLAREKALKVSKLFPDYWIFSFDTLVYLELQGEKVVLGKPKDKEEAVKMLKLQSGKEQIVITGYVVLNSSKNIKYEGVERSVVEMEELSEEFIREYVMSRPVEKWAGAFGVQEDDKIVTLKEGSFYNVVGLPVEALQKIFKEVIAYETL